MKRSWWLLLTLCAAWPPAAARAQGAWNDPRALQLLERVQEHRASSARDSLLQRYSAEAGGFVYFLLDLPERGEQVLVRTDQVALEIHWSAPGLVRQHILGLRQRDELPVRRLYYYLDRLTMVQDNFGSAITIADGENVDEVPHPAAPGAERLYDYRLDDSLQLRLPGVDEPIPVYELRVRPRDANRPAIIGSLFVDGRSGALVRMRFTFTRAAYTDRRLDHINVALENALWEGRYWLPYEQRVDIRRELPELDLPAGTIIRTRLRVRDYRINDDAPPVSFVGPVITYAPAAEREAYAFADPIDAERRLEGIAAPRDLATLQREARAHVGRQALGGLPRARLATGAVSDMLRYNRAEGLALGLGGRFPLGPLHGSGSLGWAFGASQATASLGVALPAGDGELSVAASLRERRELGGRPAASELLNTIGSVVAGRDLSDLYFASGGTLAWRATPRAGTRVELGGWLERHRSAQAVAPTSPFGEPWRPVLEIDEATWAGASLRTSRRTRTQPLSARGVEAGLRIGAPLDGDPEGAYVRVGMAAEWERGWRPADALLELRAEAGAALGTLPRQELFLLGGQGTVPGHAFRGAAGDRMLLLQATGSAELWRPWLRGRLLGAAGWTDAGMPSAAARERWQRDGGSHALSAAGVGAGLFYDVLRVDLLRGIGRDGRWELVVEAHPRFRHGL